MLFQALDGVVAFYTTKDIPGQNAFTGPGIIFITEVEELFVGDRVKYHSQPAGVIVANSFELAHRAASLVRIEYARPMGTAKPLLTLKEVLADKEAAIHRVHRQEFGPTAPVHKGL